MRSQIAAINISVGTQVNAFDPPWKNFCRLKDVYMLLSNPLRKFANMNFILMSVIDVKQNCNQQCFFLYFRKRGNCPFVSA